MKHKVTKVWSPEETWSFTNDKNEVITLKSYYLDLEGTDKRYVVNRKPDSDPIKEGQEYDLELSEEKTKSGKFFKAKLKSFPDLVCPSCSFSGPLEKFRPEKEPEKKEAPKPSDDEPPLSNYDE